MNRFVHLIVLIAISACGAPPASPGGASSLEIQTTPSVVAVPQSNDALHIVASASNDVTYLRDGWRRRQVARFGTALRTGDIIDRPPNGSLVIVCADLTVPPIEPGPKGLPCSGARPVLRDGQNELTTVRGLGDAIPPQLLAPLPGALLDARPEIRWISLTATESFTITLRDQSGTLWSTVTSADKTSISFPKELALELGKRYTVTVVADGNLSSERAPGKHQIYLIDPGERGKLETHRRQIDSLAIPTQAKELLLARLYMQFELTTEAETLLAAMSAKAPTALTFLTLGDVEARAMLYERSIEHYRRAIALAEAEGDDEVIAQASWQTGRIFLEGIANPQLARDNLAKARAIYADLLKDERSPLIAELDKDLGAIAGP